MNFISCVAEIYASWSKARPYRFSWARLGHHRPGKRLLIITREQTVAHLPRFRFGSAPGSGELLWRFYRLPLVELKFSNNDVAAVRRSAVTESVAFRWLASLVVVRRHRARLDVVSGSLGTEPVRRSASGSVDTTTPRHSCTFPFFCNKLVLDVISNTYLIEGRFNDSRLVDGNNVGHQDFFFCVVISLRIVTFPPNEYSWKLFVRHRGQLHMYQSCISNVNWRLRTFPFRFSEPRLRVFFTSCVCGVVAAQQRKWFPKRGEAKFTARDPCCVTSSY